MFTMNLEADKGVLFLVDGELITPVWVGEWRDEEKEHHLRHHHHHHITGFTITLPTRSSQMDYPVSLGSQKDDVIDILTNLSDGTSRPFAGTFTAPPDGEILQTAEDGSPLPAGSYRLRVTDEAPGSYTFAFTEGGQTLDVLVTKEAAPATVSGFSATDTQVDRV